MAVDKSNRDARDRATAEQQYELAYFAGKHNLAMDDARRVLEAAGRIRDDADTAPLKGINAGPLASRRYAVPAYSAH
jgi:hypothetical protein